MEYAKLYEANRRLIEINKSHCYAQQQKTKQSKYEV